jgi:hypothetical protein
MTREEQKQFIIELTQSINTSICTAIDTQKIPETWDGHELRELLYEKFDDARSRLMQENKRGKRYQSFRNTIITQNI